MKDRLDGNRVGLVLGSFLVVVHVIWVLAIWMGFAQVWIDWIFKLHMLNNPFIVGALDWGTAVILWVAVLIVGYIVGWIFAGVHNWVHKK
jgi:hypothetical protein